MNTSATIFSWRRLAVAGCGCGVEQVFHGTSDFVDGGWIVPYDGLRSWFEDNLPRLGLNPKEKAQFEEYWTARLPRSNFYEIRLFSPAFLEKNLRLEIDPSPDSLIRLEFYFKPCRLLSA